MKYTLLDIMKMLFVNRRDYYSLSIKEKQKWGFIVNRFLSKKYIEYGQKLNVKNIDSSLVLDLWWIYLNDKNNVGWNKWVWTKNKKFNKNDKIDNKDFNLLIKDGYTSDDIYFLTRFFYSEVKEELKYLKEIEKSN